MSSHLVSKMRLVSAISAILRKASHVKVVSSTTFPQEFSPRAAIFDAASACVPLLLLTSAGVEVWSWRRNLPISAEKSVEKTLIVSQAQSYPSTRMNAAIRSVSGIKAGAC